MAMRKALIITYYDAPNYGAFLQAYAMQEFLRSHGIDGRICKHSANKPNILTKLLDKRNPADVIEYRDRIQAVINDAQQYLQVCADRNSSYDLAIIGSDEVWNVKNLTAVHLPVFFQPHKNAVKTVSYAACAGRCGVKHLKMLPYTAGIRKLDAVSVRDEHTFALSKAFGVVNPVRTLDPTFLHRFDAELPPRAIAGEYLLVYTYGMSQNQINDVRRFAKEKELKIVATGSRCDWADENPMPTPFGWLSLIKNSHCVVTSTFHGTVFSLIFNKQFATVGHPSNKVSSLLKEFRLEDRLVGEDADLKAVLSATISYEDVNEIMRQRRNESAQFILDNL